MLGTLHDQSAHVTIKRSSHWLARTGRLVGLCLRATLGRRAGGGGGALPLPVLPGGSFRSVDVTDAPALSVEGPRSVPSRISVVLIDGAIAGNTPGRECPREDGNWRPRAGETRPAGVSVGGGNAGLPRAGETLSSPDVAGRFLPVVPAGGSSSVGAANPACSDGPVVVGGPVGLCGTLSPLFHDVLGLLEHSVLDHAGPTGRHVAVGPVGPDDTLQVLDPLEHLVLDHADPAGQRAVGLFGMLSPSDCHPTGPTGPYVAGGPVDPDDTLQVLDPLEHSVLDHADPAGQRAAVGPVRILWVGFSMTPATYPVPPVPMMSFVDSVPLEVAPPAGLSGESGSERPCCAKFRHLLRWLPPDYPLLRRCCDPHRMSVRHLVWQLWTRSYHGVLHCHWGFPRIPLCFRLP